MSIRLQYLMNINSDNSRCSPLLCYPSKNHFLLFIVSLNRWYYMASSYSLFLSGWPLHLSGAELSNTCSLQISLLFIFNYVSFFVDFKDAIVDFSRVSSCSPKYSGLIFQQSAMIEQEQSLWTSSTEPSIESEQAHPSSPKMPESKSLLSRDVILWVSSKF